MSDSQPRKTPSVPGAGSGKFRSDFRRLPKATLQRKVQRTMSFAVFLIILVFSAGMFSVNLISARQNGSLYSATVSALLADQIHSGNLLGPGVDTKAAGLAIADLADRLSALTSTTFSDSQPSRPSAPATQESVAAPVPTLGHGPFRITGLEGNEQADALMNWRFHVVKFRVDWNGTQLYQSPDWNSSRLLPDWMPDWTESYLTRLFSLFTVEASAPLQAANGDGFGLVTTRMDTGLFGTYMLILVGSLLVAWLPLSLFTHFTARRIAKRVSRPISTLVDQLGLLAGASPEAAANVPLTFRKPPFEVASIAESLLRILDRMREFNTAHVERTNRLAQQGKELESQNQTLDASRRQIQAAQSQMIQTQNLASIGQITAGISHEMNTPLGTIGSNVQLQEMLLDMLATDEAVLRDPEMAAFLTEMKKSSRENARFCQAATDMVRSLKNFSRLDQADYQETDLNSLIRNVVTLTTNLWKDRIRLHGAYGDIPAVKCWPGLLNQLFMSLLTNAFEAVPGEGDIWIRTIPDGDSVLVEVEDNGPGVPDEMLERIFEPGFSLGKKAADGQQPGGMGLAMARDIVARHNAVLKAEHGESGGLLLSFRLPMHTERT